MYEARFEAEGVGGTVSGIEESCRKVMLAADLPAISYQLSAISYQKRAHLPWLLMAGG